MTLTKIKSYSSIPTLLPNNYFYYANNLINLPKVFDKDDFKGLSLTPSGIYSMLTKVNHMELIINQFNIHLKNFTWNNLYELDVLVEKYLVGELGRTIEEMLECLYTEDVNLTSDGTSDVKLIPVKSLPKNIDSTSLHKFITTTLSNIQLDVFKKILIQVDKSKLIVR